MKKIVRVLLSAACLVGLANCSSKDGSVESLNFTVQAEAQHAFTNSTVDCDVEGNACPSFSGSMFVYSEYQEYDWLYGMRDMFSVNFCSVQLIGNNRVLTNRHCLPDDLQSAGADCRGRIYFKFPNTNQIAAEAAHCRSIVDLTSNAKYKDKDTLGPDWAVLEMASAVTRRAAETSTAGFIQNQSVHLFPSYFDSGHSYMGNGQRVPIGNASIRRVNCEVRRDNLGARVHYHQKAPLFNATCDDRMVGGNSGTAVLNSDQTILGIHSHSLEEDSNPSYLSDSPRVLDRATEGTNLHCVPYFNSNPDQMCYYDANKKGDLDKLSVDAAYNDAMVAAMESHRDEIVNENESQAYVRYGDVSQNFVNFVLSNTDYNYKVNLPDYLIQNTLGESYAKVFTHFPSCVEPSAPSSFSTEFTKPYLSKRQHDNRANLVVEIDTSKNMLEYTREGDQYQVTLARAEDDVRLLYRSKLRTQNSHKTECVNAGTYSRERLCNRYTETVIDLSLWMSSQDTEPSVFTNESEIYNSGDATFTEVLPICEG
ncbi:MAG: trypsin-like serine protease [Bdellovibrionales bacterium]|nr:trypsin-like serine protease [Bdellovibrionales bacterium]